MCIPFKSLLSRYKGTGGQFTDEPTGNLDSKTSQDVLELIQNTSRKFKQSVVMITHNEHIADLAERIVRIEDGKFLKTGVGEDEKIRE